MCLISLYSVNQVLSDFMVNFLFKYISNLNESNENAYAKKVYADVSEAVKKLNKGT